MGWCTECDALEVEIVYSRVWPDGHCTTQCRDCAETEASAADVESDPDTLDDIAEHRALRRRL